MINIYRDVEQGSIEWHLLRDEDLTGSHATEIAASGAGLKTYCSSKVAKKNAKEDAPRYYNDEMARGDRLEPIGVFAYEVENDVDVLQVGYVTNDLFERIGISPDGLIMNGEDIEGGIEIKARNDEKHTALIRGCEKEIPKNQIQMNILITGAKWWDFVSINTNQNKPLFVKRIYPDEAYHEKLKKGFKMGVEMVKEFTVAYNEYTPSIK